MENRIPLLFIGLGLIALLAGSLVGCIGGLQYLHADFLKKELPFFVTRPLHVSLVVSWIFSAAIGGIYFYVQKITKSSLLSINIASIHFLIFLFVGLLIISSYLNREFGGREYWEFPPYYSIPIIIGWILFMYNFFGTTWKKIQKWPVYLWMWGTGICFFLITYIESHLWTIPYFRDNILRDLTVQWKSYGSLVGSWNMMVYGTAFYLMHKISGNKEMATSKSSFFFYFLGLTNLMFGWAHHTYLVPVANWIRYVSYAISMTEWIVLGKIIWDWRIKLNETQKFKHLLPYRFLMCSEIWIFLNLILAILISIPAVQLITHGTHITVAHAMGSTIGINTMILLASVSYIIPAKKKQHYLYNIGLCLTNVSLIFFWCSLIIAGYFKGTRLLIGSTANFSQVMNSIEHYLWVFVGAGFGIFIGVLFICLPQLKSIYQKLE